MPRHWLATFGIDVWSRWPLIGYQYGLNDNGLSPRSILAGLIILQEAIGYCSRRQSSRWLKYVTPLVSVTSIATPPAVIINTLLRHMNNIVTGHWSAFGFGQHTIGHTFTTLLVILANNIAAWLVTYNTPLIRVNVPLAYTTSITLFLI